MSSHRGASPSRVRERNGGPSSLHYLAKSSEPRQTIVVFSDVQHQRQQQPVRRKDKQPASPCRSCARSLDSSSLGTEGTGISTLTGSSSGGGGERRYNTHSSRVRAMAPQYFTPTIYEDELQSRTTQSSYISRPIDVDSMQEYDEEDEALKPPPVVVHDDSQSRTTTSTYSSRPIDVDSALEYDPEEYSEPALPEERSEKFMDFSNRYYEGESLLEYSSDDESVDFDTGFRVASSSSSLQQRPHGPEVRTVSVKRLPNVPRPSSRPLRVSVDLVGPIHSDTRDESGPDDEGSETDVASFRDIDFPILDERDFDRELIGYMEGFEPMLEDLPPKAPLGRKRSDATASVKTVSTRVIFEI